MTIPFISTSGASGDYWRSKTPIPTVNTTKLGAAVADEKIYVIGGADPLGTILNQAYDLQSDSWDTKASMPTQRHSFAVAAYQNKIFVIGGYYSDITGSKITGSNEMYNPMTDTWEPKASMLTKRYQVQGNVVEDRIYVIGGIQIYAADGKEGYSSLTEVYDPKTDTWIAVAPMPIPAAYYSSAVIDNKIHVLSGTTHQIYDCGTNTWSYGASPPQAIMSTSAVGATSGANAPKRIYVIGAFQNKTINQVYDPTSDSWSIGSSMPTARYWCSIAAANDKIYVIGGIRDTLEIPQHYFSANEEYTPFGYGNPNSTGPLPTLSPTLSPTQSPPLNLTPSPTTLPPTQTPPKNPQTSQFPNGSPSSQPQIPLSTDLIYIAAASTAAILAVATIIIFLKKRK